MVCRRIDLRPTAVLDLGVPSERSQQPSLSSAIAHCVNEEPGKEGNVNN